MLLLSGAVIAQENSKPNDVNPQPEKKCSSIIRGLQLCTTSPDIKIKLGEKVVLALSMINTTDKEKLVDSVWKFDGEFQRYPPYEITITDEHGNRYPTIEDDLSKKSSDGTITEKEADELFLRCCLNKGSRWGISLSLAPNQEYKFDWELSPMYDFKAKGRYFVEVRRNVAVQNQKAVTVIKLENIELNIL